MGHHELQTVVVRFASVHHLQHAQAVHMTLQAPFWVLERNPACCMAPCNVTGSETSPLWFKMAAMLPVALFHGADLQHLKASIATL